MQNAERHTRVLHVQGDQYRQAVDTLATETPIAFEFNGISHAVMLASPIDLEDLARGFALTEGIIDEAKQLYDVHIDASDCGFTIKLIIASSCFARMKDKRRQMTGSTGCGICGAESLTHVLRSLPSIPTPHQKLNPDHIPSILEELNHHQPLQHRTGATHAAAWFDLAGKLKLVREDIGRHNALDKVIGAVMGQYPTGQPDGPIVVTSRASLEMVQKSLIAQSPYLIALSAPTSLAVEMADRHGLCLIGFARHDSFNVYTHPELLSGPCKPLRDQL